MSRLPPPKPPGAPPRPSPPRPPSKSNTKHQQSRTQQQQLEGVKRLQPTYFDESHLPSRKDGISSSEERDKRHRTCRFIETGGSILRLPRVAVATAMVFFHRFYSKHSFAEHDRFEVAIACLLLAAKTEESPKKLSVVIIECWKLKNRGLQQQQQQKDVSTAASSSSLDPSNKKQNINPLSFNLDSKSSEYTELRERILLLERVILHTIAFELSIDHPYKFLVEAIKKYTQSRLIEYSDPRKQSSGSTSSSMINELVQHAMNFANDSMHTCLCLQYPAKVIAMSCVYLSAKYSQVKPIDSKNWLDILGIDYDALSPICIQIMELIADRRKLDIQVFKSIHSDLKSLKNIKLHHSQSSSNKKPRMSP